MWSWKTRILLLPSRDGVRHLILVRLLACTYFCEMYCFSEEWKYIPGIHQGEIAIQTSATDVNLTCAGGAVTVRGTGGIQACTGLC